MSGVRDECMFEDLEAFCGAAPDRRKSGADVCTCCGLMGETTLYPVGSGAFMEFCPSCAQVWLAKLHGKDSDCVQSGTAEKASTQESREFRSTWVPRATSTRSICTEERRYERREAKMAN